MRSGLFARSAEPIVPKLEPGLELPEYPSLPGYTESEPEPGPGARPKVRARASTLYIV